MRNNQIEYLRGKCDHWNKKLKIKTSASNYDEVSLYHTKSPTFHSCIETTAKFKQCKIWVNFLTALWRYQRSLKANKGRQHLRGQNLKEKRCTEMSKHFPLCFLLRHLAEAECRGPELAAVSLRLENKNCSSEIQKAARTRGANFPEKREQKRSKSNIVNRFYSEAFAES